MSYRELYEELEPLGRGSYGTVYKIRCRADDKILVGKEIDFLLLSDREKSQLIAEIIILKELKNPFVVSYHDRIVDKVNSKLYIIMEYCAGGDLDHIIEKCKRDKVHLDEKFIWRVMAQSVVALKDCHRRVENGALKPILHRDLKPANILFDANQNIKIGDFGLAKELSGKSKLAQTSNVGTPYYMAPEIMHEKEYDERSDIWSLGCLLYELAALKPPFEAVNTMALALKINAGKFNRIPNIYSDLLFDAIRSMLQLDLRKRPRVENLECIPGIEPEMMQARLILSEYKMQKSFTSKQRDLKAKEEELQQREYILHQREVALVEREKHLNQLTEALYFKRQQQHFSSTSCADHDEESRLESEVHHGRHSHNVSVNSMPSEDGAKHTVRSHTSVATMEEEEDDSVSGCTCWAVSQYYYVKWRSIILRKPKHNSATRQEPSSGEWILPEKNEN